MDKKILTILGTWLTIALCSIALSSCGDSKEDHEDPVPVDRTPTLVGVWTCSNHFYSGTDTYTFKSNNTYEWTCPDFDNERGDYYYNPSLSTLTITNEEGVTRLYFVLSLTESFFVIADQDGDRWTYKRRGADIDDEEEKDKPSTTPLTESNVKAGVDVYFTYSEENYDYGWDIDFITKLSIMYPGKTIEYGIECGYGSYDYYINATKESEDHYSLSAPLLFDTYGDAVDFALNSIANLEAKRKRGEYWTDDDYALYNENVKLIEETVKKAKREYKGRAYAKIDGTKYYLETFGI